MQMPATGPNLVSCEDWEKICQRLTLGYFTESGTWIPGTQENIRDLRADMNGMLKSNQTRDSYDRWAIRVVLVIVAIRFLGVESITGLLKLFGIHA